MHKDVIDGMVDLAARGGPGSSSGTRVGDTIRGANDDTAVNERRFGVRYPVDRDLIVIPLLADRKPDWKRRTGGRTLNVSPDGMGLAVPSGDYHSGQPVIIGVPGGQGTCAYSGVEVRFVGNMASDRVHLGGCFSGVAHALLQVENLAPRFDPKSLAFVHGFPEEVLRAWEEVGVLAGMAHDRALLCPRCHSVPTYRHGCGNCGSINAPSDRFIHHFACAHVDFAENFEADGELMCPKCRTRHLIVGADFDYQQGEYSCRDCNWTDTELALVAECLRCKLRFPFHQAVEAELRGYHAHRLDPLALREAS